MAGRLLFTTRLSAELAGETICVQPPLGSAACPERPPVLEVLSRRFHCRCLSMRLKYFLRLASRLFVGAFCPWRSHGGCVFCVALRGGHVGECLPLDCQVVPELRLLPEHVLLLTLLVLLGGQLLPEGGRDEA